jgi:hypothetical protein
MRRFVMHRHQDASGVSGIGVVAQGIQFDDGTCALRWLTEHSSTAIYASAADVELIHGHGGRTELIWVDPVPAIEVQFTDTPPTLQIAGRRQEIIARLRAFE